ncbi:S1 family peptidase [Flavitalea flava]
MNKILSPLLACLLFLANNSKVFADNEEDATVRIYANTTGGRGQSGSGFFAKVNNQIYICTAYHVIYGARTIEVKCVDGDLTSISIAGYDEQKDLVLLNYRTTKHPSRIKAFTLIENLPQNLTSIPGHFIGHPKTITYSHYPVSFTNNEYIEAKKIDCFRYGLNLNLLGISTTIYDGDSGAPVLTQNGAIGVISGSYNEGGSFTWAIPSFYITRLTILSNPIVDPSKLPPLNMFEKNVNKLTRDYNITQNVQSKYYPFLTVNSTFKNDNGEFESTLNEMVTACITFKNSIAACDTYQQWNAQYGIFDARYNALIGKVDDYEKRNDEDVDRWTRMVTDIRSHVNREEFTRFLVSNGQYIDQEKSSISNSILANKKDKDRLHSDATSIKAALHMAGVNNDYPALKLHSYDWIVNLSSFFTNMKNNLRYQNQLIQLNEIMENAMVECQTYN